MSKVNTELLESKCKYFADIGLWPIQNRFDPKGWLSNFSEDELEYANQLLDNFVYYSKTLVERLFTSAFQNLSQSVINFEDDNDEIQASWNTFLSRALVVIVTGEDPNNSDSGYIFARMTRDIIGLQQEQLVTHEEALDALYSLSQNPPPIIFVDDFVGSGNQFKGLWKRQYLVNSIGRNSSYRDAANSIDFQSFYCPIVSTKQGFDLISALSDNLKICPAHILSSRYSAISPDSSIWRDKNIAQCIGFLKKVSDRAGIPENNGNVDDWRGFHKLALTIGFEHGTPDATLPIFYWDKNDWIPLVKYHD